MVNFVTSAFRDFVIKALYFFNFFWIGLECLVFLDRY